MTYFLVFLAMFVSDAIWTRCVLATVERRGLAAASWATFMFLCAIYVTRSYVADWKMALPAMAGAFLGTFAAVSVGRHSRPR